MKTRKSCRFVVRHGRASIWWSVLLDILSVHPFFALVDIFDIALNFIELELKFDEEFDEDNVVPVNMGTFRWIKSDPVQCKHKSNWALFSGSKVIQYNVNATLYIGQCTP